MTRRVIAGSRAIVTGASAGIGRAIALEFARRGADVVLLARDAARLQNVVAACAKLPGRVELVAGDVTALDVRRQAIDRAVAAFGGLDMLVNNAGIGAFGRFDHASPDRLRRIMDVNFFAAAEFIRQALPTLRQGRRPIIVNVSSILGHRGIPLMAEYCASKFALQGLSESLRAEFHSLGVDVLVVSPGTTDTDFQSHVIERTADAPWGRRRGISADKVAHATVRAIVRGKSEVFPSMDARWLYRLQRAAPWLVDRIMRHYG